MKLSEIVYITQSRESSWKKFHPGPKWPSYQLIPVKFQNYTVLMRSEEDTKTITIVDQNKFQDPAKTGKRHQIKGIERNIPSDAIVGGIALSIAKGGPMSTSWAVDYLSFNPEYQGRGLPVRFYKWIIESHQHTGVGAIKAGRGQTIGSQRLWANLSKILMVFAYDPSSKQVSQVEIGDDGNLKADFNLYPNSDISIKDPHVVDTASSKQQSRDKQIDAKTYDQQNSKLLIKQDQKLTAAKHARTAELYAVLPKQIKKKK